VTQSLFMQELDRIDKETSPCQCSEAEPNHFHCDECDCVLRHDEAGLCRSCVSS